jgi:8-oxo-dGTP pyrophosphatase MutT (NUDIX family)
MMKKTYAIFTESVIKIGLPYVQETAIIALGNTLLEFVDPRNDVDHPSCSSGLLITDGKVFLAELPYGNMKGKSKQYDLPKGHVENDGETVKDAAFREALEETGYNWQKYYENAHGVFRKPVPFRKGNNLMLYRINLEEMPPLDSYACKSYFHDEKKNAAMPEACAYEYLPLKEIGKWLWPEFDKTFKREGIRF